jgi:hypothetical protein
MLGESMEVRMRTASLLQWAKRQREDWRIEILKMTNGLKSIYEMRDDQRVDTTAETVADRLQRVSELEALLARTKTKDTSRS